MPVAATPARTIPTRVGISSAALRPARRGPSPRAWGSPQTAASRSTASDHPHARGDHHRRTHDSTRHRTIPTRVGISTQRSPGRARRTIPTRVGISDDSRRVTVRVRTIPTRVGISIDGSRRWRSIARTIPTRVGILCRTDTVGHWRRTIPTRVGILGHWTPRQRSLTGPSPRAWGSPATSIAGDCRRSDHPHARGDLLRSDWYELGATRTIPTRVGIHDDRLTAPLGRSIPTRVGIPRLLDRRVTRRPVHPHARGDLPDDGHHGVIESRTIPTRVGILARRRSEAARR